VQASRWTSSGRQENTLSPLISIAYEYVAPANVDDEFLERRLDAIRQLPLIRCRSWRRAILTNRSRIVYSIATDRLPATGHAP
jgi:hypothetical protein